MIDASKIDEKLYAGSKPSDANVLRELARLGVKTVLSLTREPLINCTGLGTIFTELGITCRHEYIGVDCPPNPDQAERILRIINEALSANTGLFIHCEGGSGRTGTVLHLYYMSKGMTYLEAREHISRRRPQCDVLSDIQKEMLGA